MRATTVRFDEELWRLLEREARAAGVSAAQFVRDAAILRIATLAARRGDEEAALELADVAAAALAGRARAARPQAPPAILPAVVDRDRVAALHASSLLERVGDPAFERASRVASKALDTPVAALSLLDAGSQVVVGAVGLPVGELPYSHSLCQYSVQSRAPVVINDARRDVRFAVNGAVTELGLVSYAGVPLVDDGGHALGVLCVADHVPRSWSGDQIDVLIGVAESTLSEATLRARGAGASPSRSAAAARSAR